MFADWSISDYVGIFIPAMSRQNPIQWKKNLIKVVLKEFLR